MISKRYFVIATGVVLSALASCTPSDEAQSAKVDTAISTSNGDLAPLPVAGTRYVVAPSGNEVRYRVREQLVGFDLPNDAIGKSAAVTGAIAIDDAGKVIRDASRFVIDAATFAASASPGRRSTYSSRRVRMQLGSEPTIGTPCRA